MKKNILLSGFLLIALLFAFVPAKIKNQHALTKKWQTDSILKVPESVIYDAANIYLYVSNINGDPEVVDGNGFISKLTIQGKIEILEWVKGLDAPKGMGIFKGKLYVADITKIVVIDIATGTIDRKISIPGSVFLNDITLDKFGNVYISDSSIKKVYLLKNGVVTTWFDGTKSLKSPNGLLATDAGLKLIDMESGNYYNIGYADKKMTKIAENVPAGDGIVEIGKDEYIISGWQGELFNISGENVQMVLDTKELKLNAADIWYMQSEKTLLVPTFFGNTVVAYQLN